MIYSIYCVTPAGEQFLQTSDDLTFLQKQSKHVYTRWMGEMGAFYISEETTKLKIYMHGQPYLEAPFAVPRRAWVSCELSTQ